MLLKWRNIFAKFDIPLMQNKSLGLKYFHRCNLKFASMDDLQSHARSMHATDDVEYMKFINKTCGVFGCPFCQKTVSNEKILARHIEKIHK